MNKHWRLSRGQRTLRNLLLGALLLTLVWGLAGWPLPTGELEIRRLEREYLMGSTEVVRVHRTEYGVALLTEGDSWITVGKATAVKYGDMPGSRMIPVLNHVLPKEDLVVVALPGPGEGGALTVAVWGAPLEAVSGTLELDLIGVDGGVWPTPEEETFTAQGTREENGWFFFRFFPHSEHPGREICAIDALWEWEARIIYGYVGEHPYRLALKDGQGAEVAFRIGTLPPNQCLTDSR